MFYCDCRVILLLSNILFDSFDSLSLISWDLTSLPVFLFLPNPIVINAQLCVGGPMITSTVKGLPCQNIEIVRFKSSVEKSDGKIQ